MLVSAGKSALIGEMLTMRNAASELPGDCHMKEVLSALFFFQRCGTVQVISCCAHSADCPPAMAADCSAVGSGGSASSSAEEDEDEEEVPESPTLGVPGYVLVISEALRDAILKGTPSASRSTPPTSTSATAAIRTLTPVDIPFFAGGGGGAP
jgi:hypothetical protein